MQNELEIKEEKKGMKPSTKKTLISIIFCLVLMPVAVFSMWKIGGKSYYLGGLIMIILSTVPFFVNFEGRKPMPRELVVIAVLSAIAAISRVAFQFIPHFSPIMGFIIIAGMSFGPQAGFLTGAISAFVSNFIAGQGPWTPWQMFAYGMSGFVAGFLVQKGVIGVEKIISTCVFGAVCIMVLVGPLLDLSAYFMIMSLPTNNSLGATLLAGFPVNAVLAASTVLTLALFSKPMGEKLERIKVKYGMMEEQ